MALNSYHDGGALADLRQKLYSNIQDDIKLETFFFQNDAVLPTFDIPNGAEDFTFRIRKELVNDASKYTHDGAGNVTADPAAAYTGEFPVNTRAARKVTVSTVAFRDSLDTDTYGAIDPSSDGAALAYSIAKQVEKHYVDEMLGATLTNADISVPTETLTNTHINRAKRNLAKLGLRDLIVIGNEDSQFQLEELFGQEKFAGSAIQEDAVRRGQVGGVSGLPFFMTPWLDNGDAATNTVFVMDRRAFQVAESKALEVDIRQHSTSLGFRTLAEYQAGLATVHPGAAIRIVTKAS